MQNKKVVDWIKFQNLRESTRNYTALKGLGRINKILSKTTKYGLLGLIIFIGSYSSYRMYKETMETGIDYFEKRLDTIHDKQRVYLTNHVKLSLEYANNYDINYAEDKSGITYYREKLLKNANGLVLETCII